MSDATALIYEEARRRLMVQEARIDNIRSRAMATISAAGLVMGLFGFKALDAHPTGWRHGMAIAAVIVFAAEVAMVVYIHWPFQIDQGDRIKPWLDKLRDHDGSADDYAQVMAHSFENAEETNAEKYQELAAWALWTQVGFGLLVVLWAVVFLV